MLAKLTLILTFGLPLCLTICAFASPIILSSSVMSLNREKIVDWPNPIPFNQQSVPVPGTKRPGQTGQLISTELEHS